MPYFKFKAIGYVSRGQTGIARKFGMTICGVWLKAAHCTYASELRKLATGAQSGSALMNHVQCAQMGSTRFANTSSLAQRSLESASSLAHSSPAHGFYGAVAALARQNR